MKGKLKINQKRRKRTKRLRPGLTLILLFTLFGFGSSIFHLWQLRQNVEQQLALLGQQKAALVKQQKDLKEEIVLLNTPSYIEQLAREELGLVKHGEIMIAPKQQ